METQSETLPGVSSLPASVGTAQPNPAANGRVFKSSPEQREKWRLYKLKQKSAKTGVPFVAPIPVAPSAADPASPGSAVPGHVPWNPDGPLAGVFKTIVPAVEKFNVRTLVEAARKIGDPEFELLVQKEAPWNPEAREVLEKTGPEVAAKLLNRAGISSENAPEVAFFLTAIGIAVSQSILAFKVSAAVKAKAEPSPEKSETK
jgi:hypothetical protein